ncbi:hypothetical protein [Paenibacillus rhizolycopersici]|uniref:hypothetical protein n=1 Tax=Paenibacillus rhizolycopersici TaxID=2780073 RepID=UPI003D2C17BD
MMQLRTDARSWFRGVTLELKVQKQPMAWLALLLFVVYILGIVLSDPGRPRNVYYFSEMALFSLAIIIPLLLFQREIGGGGMEVIATYPISLRMLAFRRWLVSILLTAGLGMVLMSVYAWHFGGIWTLRYPWNGAEVIPQAEMTAGSLILQNLPAYVLLISLSTAGIIAFRRIYGGLVLGFAVWVLDTMSSGEWLGRWTLYASYLKKTYSFPHNRIGLLIASLILLAFAVWLIGKRERWISVEEE